MSRISQQIKSFFRDKIRLVKDRINLSLTNLDLDPLFADNAYLGACYTDLPIPTPHEVLKLVNSMPSKSSAADRFPASLIKSCSDVFVPLITRLAHMSFTEGVFPSVYKNASVTPLLKKKGLDNNDPANFRPISNLNTISKILERLFLSRLMPHIESSCAYSKFQSAYRRGYSTETTIVRLLNDVYLAADRKCTTLLVSLDLSAAFDCIDVHTMLRRLENTFGITNIPLRWLSSYMKGRSQFVRVGSATSETTICEFGVPQGSVLGPILFALYICPITELVTSSGVNIAQYADDSQLYIHLQPNNCHAYIAAMKDCFTLLHNWFSVNGLQLNAEKSESILLGSPAMLRSNTSLTELDLEGTVLPLSTSIRNLGVYIDHQLNFNLHVDNLCRTSYYHIRSLRHARNCLDVGTAREIASCIVGSRLDYCNSVLYGTSKQNVHKLQLIQNTLARVVVGARKRDHITPVLRQLHWLPVVYRIQYKIAILTFKAITTDKPGYLSELISFDQPTRQLRSSAHRRLTVTRCRTNFGSRAFYHAAPAVWNGLPSAITSNLLTLDAFKRAVKTHFFEQSVHQ